MRLKTLVPGLADGALLLPLAEDFPVELAELVLWRMGGEVLRDPAGKASGNKPTHTPTGDESGQRGTARRNQVPRHEEVLRKPRRGSRAGVPPMLPYLHGHAG